MFPRISEATFSEIVSFLTSLALVFIPGLKSFVQLLNVGECLVCQASCNERVFNGSLSTFQNLISKQKYAVKIFYKFRLEKTTEYCLWLMEQFLNTGGSKIYIIK